MSSETNLNMARMILDHASREIAWLVDDDRAVSMLLSAASELLVGSGMTPEQAAEHLHLHASALHQIEVQRLRENGLLMT